MTKKYQAYLIDLDGTIYFGKNRIPSAEAFINQLIAENRQFLFMTNNATRTPEEVAEHLREHYQLPVSADHVYTSSLALINYLNHYHKGESIHIVGEPSLRNLVEEAGFNIDQTEEAKVVVQALDRQTDYQKLTIAANAIRNGATFLVTNTDRSIPTEKGMIPSSGALTAFLSHTTGVKPIIMGKPYLPILEGCLERLGLKPEDVLVIGDNYETDIMVGINAGVDTMLVLTGVTTVEQANRFEIKPTFIVNDLSEWEL